MKMDNLDLFKDLMEQGKVKAQIDAEDMASGNKELSDIGTRLLFELLLNGRSPSEGVDVHVAQNDTKDGLAVSMKGSALGLSMATCSVVHAFFSSLDEIYGENGNAELKKNHNHVYRQQFTGKYFQKHKEQISIERRPS